jgi:hypothetical protein
MLIKFYTIKIAALTCNYTGVDSGKNNPSYMARYKYDTATRRSKQQGFGRGTVVALLHLHACHHVSRSTLDPLALSYGTARGSSLILTSGSVTKSLQVKNKIPSACLCHCVVGVARVSDPFHIILSSLAW